MELWDPAAVLPPFSSQLGLGLWTPQSAGVGEVSAKGAQRVSRPHPRWIHGLSAPHLGIRWPLPLLPRPPPAQLVGASRPCGRTPRAGRSKAPKQRAGCGPHPQTQPNCTAHVGVESMRRAQHSGLKSSQTEQVAPQQACPLCQARWRANTRWLLTHSSPGGSSRGIPSASSLGCSLETRPPSRLCRAL